MWRDAGLAGLSGNALLLRELLPSGLKRGSLNSQGPAESQSNQGQGHLLCEFHAETVWFGRGQYKSCFISALRLCLVYFFLPFGEKRIVFTFLSLLYFWSLSTFVLLVPETAAKPPEPLRGS